MKRESLLGLILLVLATLACGPVIAISWNEFLVIVLLIAAFLGPPIYRLVRRLEKYWNRKDK